MAKRIRPKKLTDTADTITVLFAQNGKFAAKRFTRDDEGNTSFKQFNAGGLFSPGIYEIEGIHGLSTALLEIETYPTALVIRGAPRAHVDLNGRLYTRRMTNFLTPASGRRWALIDVDKLPLPEGLSLERSVPDVLDHVILQLPRELHNATVHWQLSSSAGVFPEGPTQTVSVHLWFWLREPTPDAELKRWGKHWNETRGAKLIDVALFQDVQSHYTAAPEFKGMDDPFPVRSGLLKKASDCVDLQLPAMVAPLKSKSNRSKTPMPASAGSGFEYHMDQIGDHPGGDGFHEPILRATASYVSTYGADATDVETLFELVRARVLSADCRHHSAREVEQRASRDHIVPMIESALKKFGQTENVAETPSLAPGVEAHFKTPNIISAEAFQVELLKLLNQ